MVRSANASSFLASCSTRNGRCFDHHMLALYNGQAVTLGVSSFQHRSSAFFTKFLMHPFKEAKPGTYRTLPIGITNYHVAFFPFHTELCGLMADYFEWLRTPPEGPTTHPFLRACDIFLVTAHLHPFQDGNGRMARMLASLAMAHGGCRPAVFRSEIVASTHKLSTRHSIRARRPSFIVFA